MREFLLWTALIVFWSLGAGLSDVGYHAVGYAVMSLAAMAIGARSEFHDSKYRSQMSA